jgi:hypothetical protein
LPSGGFSATVTGRPVLSVGVVQGSGSAVVKPTVPLLWPLRLCRAELIVTESNRQCTRNVKVCEHGSNGVSWSNAQQNSHEINKDYIADVDQRYLESTRFDASKRVDRAKVTSRCDFFVELGKENKFRSKRSAAAVEH